MPPKKDTRAVIFCRLTDEERSQYVLVRDDDCRQTTTNAPKASHHPETGIVDSNIVVEDDSRDNWDRAEILGMRHIHPYPNKQSLIQKPVVKTSVVGGDSHSNWADKLEARNRRRAFVVEEPAVRQQREFIEAETKDTGRPPSKKYLTKKPVTKTSLDKKPVNTEDGEAPLKNPPNTEDGDESDTAEIVYVFTNRMDSEGPTTAIYGPLPRCGTRNHAYQQQTTGVDNDKESLRLKANWRPSSELLRLLSETNDRGRHPTKKPLLKNPPTKKSPLKKPTTAEDGYESDTAEIVYVFTKNIKFCPTCMAGFQQQMHDEAMYMRCLRSNRLPSSKPPRLLSDLPGWPRRRKGGNKIKDTLRERKAMAKRAVEIYRAREEARSLALH